MSSTSQVADEHKKKVALIGKKPNAEMRYRLGQFVQQALKDGYQYGELTELVRVYYIDGALTECGGQKTKAAARLGISRDHVREYHKRGEELL